MPGAQKTIIIHASPEKIFSVITDYEKYPAFLKEVTFGKVNSRNNNIVTATFGVDLKVKEIQYTIRLVEEAPNKLSWTLIQGDFMEANNGSWVLRDLGSGSTEVTYTVEIIPKVPMALSFMKEKISNALTQTSLPNTLQSFKDRAEKA